MQTFEDAFYDSTIRRAIYLERYKTRSVRQVLTTLAEIQADISAQLLRAGTDFTEARLNAILVEVDRQTTLAFARIEADLRGELTELAKDEVAFTGAALNQALPEQVGLAVQFLTPSPEQVASATFARPFEGRLLKEWLTDLGADDVRRIKGAVRMGYIEGEGIDKIVRRIVGTRAAKYTDGVQGVTRRQAEALVRTAVQHTAQHARQQVFERNAPLLKGVRWISTLDGRTTLICMGRSQQVYPIDSGPRPPAHINCRSTTTPVTRSFREMGLDRDEPPVAMQPFILDKRRLKDIPKDERDALLGFTRADESYGDWLRRQDSSKSGKAFVEDVLGPTRAKLFLDGKLDIKSFVDMKTGREFSLAELRQRHATAFAKAEL